MASVVFSRGKRATPPPMPKGDLLLESPLGIPRRRTYAPARSDEP